MEGVNGLIKFLIYVSVPLATVAIAYAGVIYMTAAGEPGKISKAHEIFRLIVTGLVIMFAAWIIVHTIVAGLTDKPDQYFNLLK